MRVKKKHRGGREELQEGCVSFRGSNRSGKGATPVSPASGVSRLWLEDRQATGRDQKKEKGELQEVCTEGQGRDQRCPSQEANELLNSASQRCSQWPALLHSGWSGQTQDRAASLASQPGTKHCVTRGEQDLDAKAF